MDRSTIAKILGKADIVLSDQLLDSIRSLTRSLEAAGAVTTSFTLKSIVIIELSLRKLNLSFDYAHFLRSIVLNEPTSSQSNAMKEKQKREYFRQYEVIRGLLKLEIDLETPLKNYISINFSASLCSKAETIRAEYEAAHRQATAQLNRTHLFFASFLVAYGNIKGANLQSLLDLIKWDLNAANKMMESIKASIATVNNSESKTKDKQDPVQTGGNVRKRQKIEESTPRSVPEAINVESSTNHSADPPASAIHAPEPKTVPAVPPVSIERLAYEAWVKKVLGHS